MTQSKAFRISEREYKKALKNGAKSIIGKHEKVITAEVKKLPDGSCWLAYECEVANE